MPKRLLLCNLKELYSCFKLNYLDEKVSFSKFASLQPECCIKAGPKNTHSVCVCSYHQNVKLLLSSVGIEHLYYEIIDMIVRNRGSKECMVHRCKKCQDWKSLQIYPKHFKWARGRWFRFWCYIHAMAHNWHKQSDHTDFVCR